jgi:hypothetical protein
LEQRQQEQTLETDRDLVADIGILSKAVQSDSKSAKSAPGSPTSWFKISFADIFIIALVIWSFASGPHGWAGLLADGDAGWHIRVGEMILDSGNVPHTDPFSFSKPGQPWFAWEWLSDVGMALLHRAGGLKALVWFAAVLIATFAGVLLRYMMWKGSNPIIALALTLIAVGACSIHFLARPHLTTLVFIPVTAWMLDADRLRQSSRIWLLVPLFVLWTNLHGGFLAGILLVGAAAAGTVIEQKSLTAGKRYGLLTLACVAATVVNPYGIGLHQHVVSYLQSDWIRNTIQEFQSPAFRGESAMQFELLLILGIVSAAYLLAKGKIVETLWIVGFAHMALGSQRHITIFSSIATPLIAVQLTAWWAQFTAGKSKASVGGILVQMSKDLAPAFGRNSIWAGAILVGLLALDAPLLKWPTDFTSQLFPVDIMQKYKTRIASSRLLTTDQWGDYLLYHNHPNQKVFVDGRSDFYGPSVGTEYLHLINGAYDWEVLMTKYGFDLVVAPAEWPLNSLLKRDSRWKLLEDNGKTIVFEKTVPNENQSSRARH